MPHDGGTGAHDRTPWSPWHPCACTQSSCRVPSRALLLEPKLRRRGCTWHGRARRSGTEVAMKAQLVTVDELPILFSFLTFATLILIFVLVQTTDTKKSRSQRRGDHLPRGIAEIKEWMCRDYTRQMLDRMLQRATRDVKRALRTCADTSAWYTFDVTGRVNDIEAVTSSPSLLGERRDTATVDELQELFTIDVVVYPDPEISGPSESEELAADWRERAACFAALDAVQKHTRRTASWKVVPGTTKDYLTKSTRKSSYRALHSTLAITVSSALPTSSSISVARQRRESQMVCKLAVRIFPNRVEQRSPVEMEAAPTLRGSEQDNVPRSEAEFNRLQLLEEALDMAKKLHADRTSSTGVPRWQQHLSVADAVARLLIDQTEGSGVQKEVTVHEAIGLWPRLVQAPPDVQDMYVVAMLHAGVRECTRDKNHQLAKIKRTFGPNVVLLIHRAMEVSRVMSTTADSPGVKLLETMTSAATDARVLVVKIAERLHSVRNLDRFPYEKQQEVAQETLKVFVPLADRLGIRVWTSELEERCQCSMKVEAYKRVADHIRGTEDAMHRKLRYISQYISSLLIDWRGDGSIQDIRVVSAPIYRQIEQLKIEQLEIVSGDSIPNPTPCIQIIMRDEQLCWECLGRVHAAMPPAGHGKLRDFVSSPMENLYMSLNTVVLMEGEPIDVCIRSCEMDWVVWFGLGAYWRKHKELQSSELGGRLLRQLAARMTLAETSEAAVEPGGTPERLRWRHISSCPASQRAALPRIGALGPIGMDGEAMPRPLHEDPLPQRAMDDPTASLNGESIQSLRQPDRAEDGLAGPSEPALGTDVEMHAPSPQGGGTAGSSTPAEEPRAVPPPAQTMIGFHHDRARQTWDEICDQLSRAAVIDESRWVHSFVKLIEDTHTKFQLRYYPLRCVAFESALLDTTLVPGLRTDGLAFVRKLVGLVRELPGAFPSGLPVLARRHNGHVDLTRRQCAILLAAALFGVLPVDQLDGAGQKMDLPDFKLDYVLSRDQPKAKCLVCYFWRIHTASEPFLNEIVSFSRRHVPSSPVEEILRANSDRNLSGFSLDEGAIEASAGNLQADFANKWLGGGVLQGGNVQEEIRFSISPECLVGLLFCEVMEDTEAITIVGTQQFCDYRGYGRSFQPTSLCEVEGEGQVDRLNRRGPHIVALDALEFPGRRQYSKELLAREFHKAYVACLGDPREDAGPYCSAFATGNWGCGVFGGDPQLKSLIQWLAASVANRHIIYFPFGDKRVSELGEVVGEIRKKNCTPLQLWELVQGHSGPDVFDEVLRRLRSSSGLIAV